MAHETKFHGSKSQAERIADRGKNSGAGAHPAQTIKHGDGDRRTFHNLHPCGFQQAGGQDPFEGVLPPGAPGRGGR